MALEQVFAKVGINPAEFTQGELDAIEQEVVGGASVVTAVHKCAPTKSRSETFTGGNYVWSRNSDGTFNLFDVPVFAKHVRKLGMKLVAGADGAPKVEENVVVVDEKWLNHAIEINRTRRETGRYMGALHVRHHPQPGSGDEDKTEPAGRFVLKYVRPMFYDGAMVPVLYADFVKIPAAIFERIKAGTLPYRSIESLPPKFEEIDSIALLDTETPWFRLPMLTPGEEIQREVYAATCAPPGSPLRGVATITGRAAAALCYFAGGTYSEKPKDKPDEDPDEQKMERDAEDEGGEGEAKPDGKGGPIQCDACGLTHPDDGRHEDGDSERAELRGEGEGDDTMGKILEVLTSLARTNEEILKAVGAKAPTMTDDNAPVAEKGAKPSSIQSKAAEEGRLAAIEAGLDGLKREKEVKALVAKAMTDLCEYNLGQKAEEKLFAKAFASAEPSKVIESYVEAVKEHGTKMPTPYSGPKSALTGKPAPANDAELPEAVREYRAKGAEVLAKAIAAHELYLLCKEQGSVGGMSAAEFIKHRVEPGYGAALKG